jgi:hypothetical protein
MASQGYWNCCQFARFGEQEGFVLRLGSWCQQEVWCCATGRQIVGLARLDAGRICAWFGKLVCPRQKGVLRRDGRIVGFGGLINRKDLCLWLLPAGLPASKVWCSATGRQIIGCWRDSVNTGVMYQQCVFPSGLTPKPQSPPVSHDDQK